MISLPAFIRAAPQGIPRLEDVRLNASTILFTLGATILAAIACGLLPAIRASAPDFARLRESSRGATRGRNWTRDGLVVGQTALALVLLIGSGLLVRSFTALRNVDPGYDMENVFTFQFAPDDPNLRDGPAFARYHQAMMDRLRALPEVETVGLVENMPLNESTVSSRFIPEEQAGNPDAGAVLNATFAAGDYHKAMGIKLKAGRVLEPSDQELNRGNVVISEAAAKTLWPGGDVIGRRMRSNVDTSMWLTVVGVVNDVKQDNIRDTPQSLVYIPHVG
jgi:hypothetical protein